MTGLEKSGKDPVSDGAGIISILYFIMAFVSTMLSSSSLAPSDSALKNSSEPTKIISS